MFDDKISKERYSLHIPTVVPCSSQSVLLEDPHLATDAARIIHACCVWIITVVICLWALLVLWRSFPAAWKKRMVQNTLSIERLESRPIWSLYAARNYTSVSSNHSPRSIHSPASGYISSGILWVVAEVEWLTWLFLDVLSGSAVAQWL